MEELDLKELLTMVWNKKFQIIIIVAIFAIIGAVYSMYMVTPMYKSSTSLVLAKTETDSETTSSITQTEITLNQKLISTYSELIKSKAVLRQVLDNLELDVSEENFRKNVSVSSVKNTELIQITVSNENPEYAMLMANETAKVFTGKVQEMYNINNVHILDEAEKTNTPHNINHMKNIAIFAAVGFVLAMIYVFIYNLLDTTVKTSEDIEKNTGLLVLATVPEFDLNDKIKGGKTNV